MKTSADIVRDALDYFRFMAREAGGATREHLERAMYKAVNDTISEAMDAAREHQCCGNGCTKAVAAIQKIGLPP